MKIFDSFSSLVGNTPLVFLKNIKEKYNLESNIFGKLEYFNPAGSAKDRIAVKMIEDAEEKGLIHKGAVIIEPTSGNTGIGLAAVCASKGYKAIFVMPETMSVERQKLLIGYGAEIVLTDGALGMKGSIDKANELYENTPNSFIPMQFENPSNPQAHYETTGVEIWEALDGKVDILVAGIGTGGTISGIAKYLKEKNKNIEVVGIEPYESPLISDNKSGPHKIQGIGANFIPKNFDFSLCDEVLKVKGDDAIKEAQVLARCEGYLVGISSGAALCGAIELSKRAENKGKNIVAIFPDTGERYLSTELFR